MKWFNKIIKSVFTKLLVIIIVTGIAINLVVGGFFWAHRHMAGRTIHQNIVHYLNYLITDLGHPPSLSRAREIAKQTFLEIHYESPQQSWSTAGDPPVMRGGRFYVWREYPNIRFGRYHGHSLVEVNHKLGRFMFEFAKPFDRESERDGLFLILLALLVVILAGAYLSIRRVLRPVKWLNKGVQQVSRGNLKHRVPLKKSDELRDLAQAFNDMTDRIREMLQAKEQLLLDVSHELRSPLTRMKVALEFLPEGKSKESIRGDLEEMEKMIFEILETARQHHMHGGLNRQRINLVDLLHEIIPAFENQPPGIQLSDLPKTIETKVDPDQIKTVLNNVLSNALKYSQPESDSVQITYKKQEPYVILRIKDDGIGIPEQELPFIFEPFYRVDKSRSKRTGGYGLGLSLCKTIMEAHGGKIAVESAPDAGTTVSLYFPGSEV
ncbi:MAG: HAMP domain-containing histidine kinase [Desulfobacterales bacterium]|nr:MAG: HAMP domain-containing histidine kinase [Desulfobacterales bacterium]